MLHFGGLVLSKSYKVSAKKILKSYLSWHWRVMQSLKKNWLLVSNMTWAISLNHSKVWKLHFDGLFLSEEYKVWVKKHRGVIFHDTDQWCKIWINPDFSVSKMAWGIGWTFIRALNSLKICTLMGSFCPKHIKIQMKKYRRVMPNHTEEWRKAWRKADFLFKKWYEEFGDF